MLSLSRIVLEFHRDDKYPIIYGYLLYDDHIYGYYHVWIYGKIHTNAQSYENTQSYPNHIMMYGNMVIIVIPYLWWWIPNGNIVIIHKSFPRPPIPSRLLLGAPCVLFRLGRCTAQLGVELPGPPRAGSNGIENSMKTTGKPKENPGKP